MISLTSSLLSEHDKKQDLNGHRVELYLLRAVVIETHLEFVVLIHRHLVVDGSAATIKGDLTYE